MKKMSLLAVVATAALAAGCAHQPSTGMPADIASQVRAIGPVIDPPKTAAIYAPLQQKEPYRGVRVTRDVHYGTDARQALDVFVPEGATQARPVLIFVHGGGFVAGNKRAPGSPFYDNVMLAAAHADVVGVNVTYRLAPQHPWPAGAQDVGAAVRWVRDHIASYGGDPKRIYLMGHSAGAVHVASYLAFPAFQQGGLGLAGAILVSGLYEFETIPPGPPERAYFGAKAGSAEVSSLPGLLATPVPLLVAYGELDPPPFIAQSQRLNDALCARNRCPQRVFLAGHSHISEMYAVNTSDTNLSAPVLAFVRAQR